MPTQPTTLRKIFSWTKAPTYLGGGHGVAPWLAARTVPQLQKEEEEEEEEK